MGLLGVLVVVASLTAWRVAWFPLAALWVLLGAWCATIAPQPAPSPDVRELADGLMRTMEGEVVDATPVRTDTDDAASEEERLNAPPSIAQPSQQLDVELTSAERVNDREDGMRPAAGRIRLRVRWPDVPLVRFRCGDRIHADLRMLHAPDYRDPGAWSRNDYLLNEGVSASGSLASSAISITGHARSLQPACMLRNLQHDAAMRLLMLPVVTRPLPAPLRISTADAIMLTAMVTGDRTYLRHSLRVGFERTGSFHMLVVSGFHLAILAACVNWLMRRVRAGRIVTTLATIAVTLAYALFTGFGIPAQRAFWMVALYMIGRLIYRDRSAMNALGFAALCLLAANPRSLFDSSLQMTLLAVLAIGGIAAPLLARTIHPYIQATGDLELHEMEIKLEPRIAAYRVALRFVSEALSAAFHPWVGRRLLPAVMRLLLGLFELLVISATVELVMSLPMAIYFHRVTLFALPVNMLLLP